MKIPQKYIETIEKINSYLALLTLTILLYLIIFKSPHRLGTYKYLMTYLSIFEMVYAGLMILSLPQIYTKDSGFFVVMNRNVTGENFRIFNIFYFAMFSTSMANFSVHFVYRFLAIKGYKSWTQFSPSKLLIYISCPLIVGIADTVVVITFWGENESTQWFMRQVIMKISENLENLSFIGFCIIAQDENSIKYINWHSIIGIAAACLLITFSMIIMLYFGIKCYSAIRNLTNISTVSQNYRSIQNQLFFALVIQTAIPLILMHLPSAIILITCCLECSPEILGQITAIFISFYPVLDPLPNIFIIKAYRNAFFNFLSCCFQKVGPAPSESSSTLPRNVVSIMKP
ncbi:Protein CBG13894 [Caenorhabditis briggsae]|uniref:Serpentine receptor class r-10 n=1 Tax=Caenorhabditis briggsae TaxID=6238 RepID=A8XJ35_CAEBR|nr:Protein CBG13894 [Caenorhabditis briggsae]CAP32662.1 Protein CBG13894 [Caenorhabditis briggsae]